MAVVRRFRVTVDGQVFEVEVEEMGAAEAAVAAPPEPVARPPAPARPRTSGGGAVTAPLPGLVLDVKVEPGQAVAAGQVVIILEAMKMENEIVAPMDGTVAAVDVAKGTSVGAGDRLLVIEAS